jgi:hypothetical protein
MDKLHISFMVCVTKNELSDYLFCKSKEDMERVATNFVLDGWELEFAGEVKVIKDYTHLLFQGE